MTLAPPNAELVHQAWIARYSDIPAAAIASTVPDPSKWTANGFLQVRDLAGGTTNIDIPQRRSTVTQLDGYGARTANDTFRPLWAVSMTLLERVRVATFDSAQAFGKPLAMLLPGYSDARVFAAYLVSEPTKVESDPSGYARTMCNLMLDWTV